MWQSTEFQNVTAGGINTHHRVFVLISRTPAFKGIKDTFFKVYERTKD